jgi:hypothetical protein
MRTRRQKNILMFENSFKRNGVDFLDPNLTLNAQTVTPSFRYKGGDADATEFAAWGYGNDLPRVNVGVQPTYNDGSPYLSDNDDSVRFNASDYYKDPGSSFGDITTEDFVIELIFSIVNLGVSEFLFSKLSLTAGWLVNKQADNSLRMFIDTGPINVSLASGSLPVGVYHAICFVNRGDDSVNSSRWYVNGFASGGGNLSTASASLSVSNSFSLGARDDNTSPNNNCIAYSAMWKQEAWMQDGAAGTSEMDAIALERFNKLSGIYPQLAKGTPQPTVQTRATFGYTDKLEAGERKLYKMGAGCMRIARREDLNTDIIAGYIAEPAVQNICLGSQDFNPVPMFWEEIDVGDTQDLNSEISPDGSLTADGNIADATDGTHGFSQDINLTASMHKLSCYFKPGDMDWVKVQNDTIANCFAYFNVVTGAVGTVGVGATAGYIEGPFLNGFYRCGIVFTSGAGVDTLSFRSCVADNDDTFAGDGLTVNTYFWGAQLELGDYMTSYIPTTIAAVTRNADVLRFKGDDGNLGGVGSEEQGTISFDVLLPDYDNAVLDLIELSDGGSGADSIIVTVDVNDDLNVATAATAGNAGSVSVSGDVTDNVIHKLRTRYITDNLNASDDDTKGTPDTSCDMPDDLDRIDIGASKGLISNLKLHREPTFQGAD